MFPRNNFLKLREIRGGRLSQIPRECLQHGSCRSVINLVLFSLKQVFLGGASDGNDFGGEFWLVFRLILA